MPKRKTTTRKPSGAKRKKVMSVAQEQALHSQLCDASRQSRSPLSFPPPIVVEGRLQRESSFHMATLSFALVAIITLALYSFFSVVQAQSLMKKEALRCDGFIACTQLFFGNLWRTLTGNPTLPSIAQTAQDSPPSPREVGVSQGATETTKIDVSPIASGTGGSNLILQPYGTDHVVIGQGQHDQSYKLEVFGNMKAERIKGRQLDLDNSATVGSLAATSVVTTPQLCLGQDICQSSIETFGPWKKVADTTKKDIYFDKGNVGVGTDDPKNARLAVSNASGSNQTALSILQLNNNSNILQWGGEGASYSGVIKYNGDVGIQTNDPHAALAIGNGLFNNSPNPFMVTSRGVVTATQIGIGTDKPSVPLMIKGWEETTLKKTTGFLQIGNDEEDNYKNIAIDWQSIQARLANGTASSLFLNPGGGNVGIGTKEPKAKLDVNGLVSFGSVNLDQSQSPGVSLSFLKDSGKLAIGWNLTGGRGETDFISNQGTGLKSNRGNMGGFSFWDLDNTTLTEKQLVTIRKNSLDNNRARMGINKSDPLSALDIAGDITVSDSSEVSRQNDPLALAPDRVGLDVAELFTTEEDVEAGDVLVVGGKERMLKKSSTAYQRRIIGVVSEYPAILFEGGQLKIGSKEKRLSDPRKPPVALTGRVPVKVSLENGPIKVGDYLTTSSLPGVAMKATKSGEVIGVALEHYSAGGIGKVLTFLNIGMGSQGSVLEELEKRIEKLERKK